MKKLENDRTIMYKIRFIDSFRFLSSSLSSIADNLAEGLYNDKSKDCKSCFAYIKAKDEHLMFKCLE